MVNKNNEKIGLAVDAKGDVALAGHVLEDGASRVDGRKDAIVMKLASHDGSSLWRRWELHDVQSITYKNCRVLG